MDLFVAFKFLHIVSMFFAVGLALSGEVVLRRVASSESVPAIRITVARIKPITGPIAGAFFLSGLAFGFLAAIAGQFDLLRPWLLMSYAAFAAALVFGFAVTDPWIRRLELAATDSSLDQPSDALRAVIYDRRAAAGTWALMGLIALLVFLMVVKPLG
jgi:hypothetical protein